MLDLPNVFAISLGNEAPLIGFAPLGRRVLVRAPVFTVAAGEDDHEEEDAEGGGSFEDMG